MTWQVKIKAWELGGVLAYTAWTKEAHAIKYEIHHEFNKPAKATILIVDEDDFSNYQRYFDTGSDPGIHIGAGKVIIQDPIPSPDDDTTNIVFSGRITSIQYNEDNSLQIECEDWSSQLGNQRITYDMRENLDTDGSTEVYQSTAKTDIGDATYEGPVYTNGADYYMYDRAALATESDWDWDNDEFNGKWVVFTGGMAGNITVKVGPHSSSVDKDGTVVTETNDHENCWEDDSNYHLVNETKAAGADKADDFWIIYNFRVNATEGSLYSAGPSAMKVNIVYDFIGQDVAELAQAHIYAYDHTGGSYRKIGDMGLAKHENVKQRRSFNIPERYLSTIVDTDGQAHIKIHIEVPVNMYTGIYVYFIEVETDLTTTGTNSAFEITDTDENNRLKVDTDLDVSGLGIWEGCPYSIVDKIQNHINGLVTDTDYYFGLEQEALTTSLDTTTGISTARFVERTVLDILSELANADAAKWWVTLGTKVLNWEEGFDAAAVATWTDASVLSWSARLDIDNVYNEWHVYGFGDIYRNTGDIGVDPGNQNKVDINQTRSDVLRSNKIMSQYEAEQLASALVYQHGIFEYPQIVAKINGLYTTGKLGDKIQVNSTRLELTNVNHTIVQWEYNTDSNITTIYLRRTTSSGIQDVIEMGYKMTKTIATANKTATERTITDLS